MHAFIQFELQSSNITAKHKMRGLRRAKHPDNVNSTHIDLFFFNWMCVARVMYLSRDSRAKHHPFPSCREEEIEAVLRWDLSPVAVVIASNCWVITAPQAAWLNVFWLNTNDWLCICPRGATADESAMKSHSNSYLQQLRRQFSFHQFS